MISTFIKLCFHFNVPNLIPCHCHLSPISYLLLLCLSFVFAYQNFSFWLFDQTLKQKIIFPFHFVKFVTTCCPLVWCCRLSFYIHAIRTISASASQHAANNERESALQSANAAALGQDNNSTATAPPNYEELDPPPAYSVLFPNQKAASSNTLNSLDASNNQPTLNQLQHLQLSPSASPSSRSTLRLAAERASGSHYTTAAAADAQNSSINSNNNNNNNN